MILPGYSAEASLIEPKYTYPAQAGYATHSKTISPALVFCGNCPWIRNSCNQCLRQHPEERGGYPHSQIGAESRVYCKVCNVAYHCYWGNCGPGPNEF